MTKFTNETCPKQVAYLVVDGEVQAVVCGEPVATRTIGRGPDAVTIRMDTPYCHTHAKWWSDLRVSDLEASMGG